MVGFSYFRSMDQLQAHQPIGIFDSGIGGLTVAKAIHDVLPNEQLLYLGDTAHLPYGDKSPEAILQYAHTITGLLIDRGCKMVVVACNTASAIAFPQLAESYGHKIPLINVIDPVVKATLQHHPSHVGVIGTKGTIKSNTYEKRLQANQPAISVASLATPLLVPMIEEGYFDNKISHTIIEAYLKYPDFQSIDALILGCTHYPLIKDAIARHLAPGVRIMDSTHVVAETVAHTLAAEQLLHTGTPAPHHFMVSDYTHSFEQTARLFFREAITLEHLPIWD